MAAKRSLVLYATITASTPTLSTAAHGVVPCGRHPRPVGRRATGRRRCGCEVSSWIRSPAGQHIRESSGFVCFRNSYIGTGRVGGAVGWRGGPLQAGDVVEGKGGPDRGEGSVLWQVRLQLSCGAVDRHVAPNGLRRLMKFGELRVKLPRRCEVSAESCSLKTRSRLACIIVS